ncbi:MAG TPA: beta-ketoacyl-[acyl-carrier-protein] synthase family protein, partial [Polyangiaceae bacterium]
MKANARIYVTGVGLVTALASSREATWEALLRGERGLREIDLFDTTGLKGHLGGQVRDVTVRDAPTVETGSWSRSSMMAFVAAREALEQSGLDAKKVRVGLIVGGTTGGMFENEGRLAELHSNPLNEDALIELLSHPLTAACDCVSSALGPFVRTRTLSTACSSGANALMVAAGWLRAGLVDAVVAGGSDGLCRLTLTGFNALSAVDPELCRPFDKTRRGLNLGEGAGFVVLERADEVRNRKATPIAELAGWGLGSEAHHITNPEPTGATPARVIQDALRRANLSPSDIDYVNAHGTGTPLNDPMESAALLLALGDEMKRIPVSSSKGQIGHTLAASGAIEAGICALAVQRQKIVPTVGLTDPDPACPLVHVPGEGRAARVRAALTNSFGFGGMDSALVFKEANLDDPPVLANEARKVVVTAAVALTPTGLRSTKEVGELLAEGPTAHDITLDFGAHLDAARARRLDRPARIGTVIVQQALQDAGGVHVPKMGTVLSSAYGALDASAAYLYRLMEKGPRLASPAEFPNLVPSSPVGHITIYLGLDGPAIATSDLGTSGESACCQAIELIQSGEADVLVGGGVEEASAIVERRQATVYRLTPDEEKGEPPRPRAEGAAAVVFEAAEVAKERGSRVLAEVTASLAWRDGEEAPLAALASAPSTAACVVVPRAHDERVSALLDGTPWQDVPRLACDGAGGEHEALGAIAISAATSEIARGNVKDALVLGLEKG